MSIHFPYDVDGLAAKLTYTPRNPTVLLVRIKRIALIVLPADYLNELRNEARYAALENSRVPAYHVLVVYFRLIILVHHYNVYIYIYL